MRREVRKDVVDGPIKLSDLVALVGGLDALVRVDCSDPFFSGPVQEVIFDDESGWLSLDGG